MPSTKRKNFMTQLCDIFGNSLQLREVKIIPEQDPKVGGISYV